MNKRVSSGDTTTALLARLEDRSASIGIIGLGYVGLPLARTFAKAGFDVTGFDLDPKKVATLNSGKSYIGYIPDGEIAELLRAGTFRASHEFSLLEGMDAIVICVPTPLGRARKPDMRFVTATAKTVSRHLRRGQLVVLESTTYPGTTSDLVRPILERSGLESGREFHLAYSPEREDPGNTSYELPGIPKVVSGDGAEALRLAAVLYGSVVSRVVPVSSLATAEATKLTENVFRAVNIALVNELKVTFSAMGIDIWEVIEAAKTKPFGFMPFYPGPGLGGHCIPVDPFYLSWRARQFGLETRFIELAGEINSAMPAEVAKRLSRGLFDFFGKKLDGAHVLLIGLAYKKNVADTRESPGLRLLDLLERRGAIVDYHDPHIPTIPKTRKHAAFAGRRSVSMGPRRIARYDAVLICTDHENIDYAMLARHARLIVDTRNALSTYADARDKTIKA